MLDADLVITWKRYSYEIKQILENVGFKDIQVLKNFRGEEATNGEEAKIYLCNK